MQVENRADDHEDLTKRLVAAGRQIGPLIDNARAHVVANMPLYVFLSAYFLTVVFANILYVTSIGKDWPALSITNFSWHRLSVTFGFEFWLLVLLPFFALPPLAVASKLALRPPANFLASLVPEFSKSAYLVLTALLYGYAIFTLYRASASGLLVSGADAVSAVEARFAVLDALGLWPKRVMLSLLVFMAVYAAVCAARQGGWFWNLLLLWHITVLSACLVLLNMKWPVVLFIVTLGLCVLILSKRFAILKSGLVMAAGAVAYMLISVILLRLVPTPVEPAPVVVMKTESSLATSPPDASSIEVDARYMAEAVAQTREHSLSLAIRAVNRMAVSIPFYYEIFSKEGQICGTIWDRIVRNPRLCQPSTLVYTRMFGADGFEGRGTAGAATHIYGYALGGWLGALFTLALTGVAIGGFLALWPAAQNSNMIATIFVMGGYAAYFWSQLPFEAAVIYDHGIVWWALLVILYTAAALVCRTLAIRNPICRLIYR